MKSEKFKLFSNSFQIIFQDGSDSPGWSPSNFASPLGQGQGPSSSYNSSPTHKQFYQNQRTPEREPNKNKVLATVLYFSGKNSLGCVSILPGALPDCAPSSAFHKSYHPLITLINTAPGRLSFTIRPCWILLRCFFLM